MSNELKISIFAAVGKPLCVASDDGQKVFQRLNAAMGQEGANISLSFRNVKALTAAFLNDAIGQLYDNFEADDIRARLRVEDIAPDDMALLKRVEETAKLYFADPSKFEDPKPAPKTEEPQKPEC